jgi:hypothetical protein
MTKVKRTGVVPDRKGAVYQCRETAGFTVSPENGSELMRNGTV